MLQVSIGSSSYLYDTTKRVFVKAKWRGRAVRCCALYYNTPLQNPACATISGTLCRSKTQGGAKNPVCMQVLVLCTAQF
jgi:hypothetical protein